jgi:hypothetical protein
VRRVLVVANQTLPGRALRDAVDSYAAAGPVCFHVVVPATAPAHGLVYTEATARREAQGRLDTFVAELIGLGIDVTGEVGDLHPMYAISDVLRTRRFDELWISTLPAHLSKWLHQDLPRRAAREFGLPIRHVVSEPARTARHHPTRAT